MATGDDVLAQLLLGTTGQAAIQADDPYLGFQTDVTDPIGNLVLLSKGEGVKTKDKVIGGLLTGLLGGIASGASEDYQNRAKKAYQSVVLNALAGGNVLSGSPEVARPDVLSPSVFDAAKTDAQKYGIFRALEDADFANQNEAAQDLENLKTQNEILKELSKTAITSSNRNTRERALRVLASYAGGAAINTKALEKPLSLAEEGTASAPEGEVSAPNLAKRNLTVEDFIEQAGGDEELAGRMLADEVSAERADKRLEKKEGLKAIMETQQDISNTRALLGRVRAALDEAGTTGTLGLLEETGRGAQLKIREAFGDEEAAKRLAARKVLNNSGLLIAGQIRKLFPGQVALGELEKYLASSPGTQNTNAENEGLYANLLAASNLAEKKSQFLVDAIKGGMDYPSASNLFDKQNDVENKFNKIYLDTIGGKGSGSAPPTAPTESGPSAAANVIGNMIGGPQGGIVAGPAIDNALRGIGYVAKRGLQGIARTPEVIGNMFSPSTYKQAFSTPETGLETVGKGAAITAGAIKGGALGSMFALPGTILGAGAGMALGALGFDSLEEAASELAGVGTEKSVAPTLQEVGDAAELAGGGLGVGGVLKGAGAAARGIKNVTTGATRAAEGAVQSAKNAIVGIRPADLEKSFKTGKVRYYDELGNEIAPKLTTSGGKTKPVVDAADYKNTLEKSIEVVDGDGFFAGATNSPRANKLLFDKKINKAGENVQGLHQEAGDALNTIYESLSPVQKNQFRITKNPKTGKGGFDPDFSKARAMVNEADVKMRPALRRALDSEIALWENSNKSWEALQRFKDNVQGRTRFKGVAEVEQVWNSIKKEVRNAYNNKQLEVFDGVMATANPAKVGALADANLLYHSYKNIEDIVIKRTTKPKPPLFERHSGLIGNTLGLPSRLAERHPATHLGVMEKLAGASNMVSSPTGSISDLLNAVTKQATSKGQGLLGAVGTAQKKNLMTEEATPKTSAIPIPKATPYAEQAAKLKDAVISQESAGNPEAVSNVGAVGLMQIMPATAKEIANDLGVKEYDLKDPETNTKFGTYYLAKLLKQFNGNEALALTAYHSGPGLVTRLLAKTDGNTLSDILQVPFKDGGLGPVGRKYAIEVLRRLSKTLEA